MSQLDMMKHQLNQLEMEMRKTEHNREVAAHDEKIALAELEGARAHLRMKEICYQKARFMLDTLQASLVNMQKAGDQMVEEIKQQQQS